MSAPFLCLLLLAAGAVAGDEQAQKFGFEPRLENRAEGARFGVQGQAPGYPQGTALHVMLLVEGRGKTPMRMAFLKMTMGEASGFSSEQLWPNQKLGPMVYKVRVEIRLDEQVPPVRKALVQEFGWPSGHCEELGVREIEFGTVEERETFARESLESLRALVADLDRSRAEIAALIDDPNVQPPPAEKLDAAWAALGEREKKFVAYKMAYVNRLEGDLIQRIDSFTATLSRIIRYQRKGQNQKKKVVEVENEVKNVLAEIDSRLPLEGSHEQQDEPGGKSPEGQ